MACRGRLVDSSLVGNRLALDGHELLMPRCGFTSKVA